MNIMNDSSSSPTLPAETALPPEQANTLGMSDYALRREEPKGHRLGGWCVDIRRYTHRINRLFKDQVYGSADAAEAMARAYRDAITAAFPPTINREKATQIRKNNKSGISGVYRTDTGAAGEWRVYLCTQGRMKRRRFSVRKYGEEGAKAEALALREKWLAELPAKFLTFHDYADTVSRQLHPELLDEVPDVLPHAPPLSDEEIKAKLAEINARFDALRPPKLKVRVRRYGPESDSYAVYVSDLGYPARRKLTTAYQGKQSLEAMLTKARKKITTRIDQLYSPAVTEWFMHEYGNALLDPARFDPDEGFIISVWVPPELVNHPSLGES